MKIQFSHLGAIRQADITIGDVTVICGVNNTGNTYATFGFLAYWPEFIAFEVDDELISQVIEQGELEVSIASKQVQRNRLAGIF